VLNSRGTYEADVTVTRIAEHEFLWVTGSASVIRDADWITRHASSDMHVEVVDVSGAYAVIGVMGPKSRELLNRVCTTDLSHEAFPFGTSQLIDIGFFTVRATRITYVGELGWELYVPSEFANAVFDLLHAYGGDLGIRNAGYYAINALRLEKGYRAFGPELNPDYSPVEAGLLFATKLKTDIDFLGRTALKELRAAGPKRKLISWVASEGDAMLWGGELVLRDGVGVGQVTSAAFGTTTNACIGLGYVRRLDGEAITPDYLDASWTVNVGGRVVPITVSLSSPYDPTNARIRS